MPSTVSPRGTVTSPETTTIAFPSCAAVGAAGAAAGRASAARTRRTARDEMRRIGPKPIPLQLLRHRVRLAEPAYRGRLVDRARHAADDHHPHPLGARP